MEADWVGIYKGLRLPVLGVILIIIAWYFFRPGKKKDFEEAKYDMLDDDVDPYLSDKFRDDEQKSDSQN